MLASIFPIGMSHEDMVLFLKECKLAGFILEGFGAPVGKGGGRVDVLGKARCVYISSGEQCAVYNKVGKGSNVHWKRVLRGSAVHEFWHPDMVRQHLRVE